MSPDRWSLPWTNAGDRGYNIILVTPHLVVNPTPNGQMFCRTCVEFLVGTNITDDIYGACNSLPDTERTKPQNTSISSARVAITIDTIGVLTETSMRDLSHCAAQRVEAREDKSF